MEEIKEYHFPGISVFIPSGPDHIVPIDLSYDIRDNIPPMKDEQFTMIRFLGNIVFEDQETHKLVKSFNPPIMIHVRYYPHDIKAAHADPGRLKLAYWNNKKWVNIQYEFLHGQIARAEIENWEGDPPLAWGR